MKKIIYTILATLSGLVLVFSYRTSLEAVQPLAVLDSAASTGTSAAPDTGTGAQESDDEESENGDDDEESEPAAGSSSSGSTSSGTVAAGLTDGTYTGGAANTRYGAVQVQITVSGGQITDVQVPQYPNSNREDQRINARALPTLIAETTQSQSAQIDMVSGATYTSQGYIASLQSAIDQAGA